MWIRRLWLLSIILTLLISCAPKVKEDEIVQKKDEQKNEEVSIVPSYQLSEDNYKMVLPFRPSSARGVIVEQIANRVDINEMEAGLRRLSKEDFDPKKYYFEEGQFLTSTMVLDFIDKLNPERPPEGADQKQFRENPRYLSHILEQNYLIVNEDNTADLGGVSIGLALKSVYRFQTEIGGPYYYENISHKEMVQKGEEIAEKILAELRQIEGLENVPIMIALYREEEQSSLVPGNFVAKTFVEGGSNQIGKWTDVNEEYVLFPSEKAKEKYFDDAEILKSFGDELAKYFPNYVGYVGEGFYVNKDLKKLSIEVPIEFYSKSEITGFTQYAYGLIKEMFSNYYDLEFKVTSSDGVESLIYRTAGQEEPIVHIFY